MRKQVLQSGLTKSSPKAGSLSLKALLNQDGFRWNLYESRMAFVESSMKARWLLLKALRKQDGFRWKLFESRMAFVQSPVKAFQINCDNTKFRDKIEYVRSPSFRRRPWPFALTTSATLFTYGAIMETCDLWDIWSKLQPDLTNQPTYLAIYLHTYFNTLPGWVQKSVRRRHQKSDASQNKTSQELRNCPISCLNCRKFLL